MSRHHVAVPASLVRKKTVARSQRAVRMNTYTVNKEIIDWLKASAKNHWFIREDRTTNYYHPDVYVVFNHSDDAMLFKLTWI